MKMPLYANYDDVISPKERVKRQNTRRWSDSPTLLRDSQAQSDRCLSAGHEHTQSLHDLTNPCGTKVSSGSQINLSSTTFQSGQTSMSLSKSRDSGFNKSASCLSLNSSNAKYSHVESKVKKYVQGIKEAEALRRKSMSTDCVNRVVPAPSPEEKKPGSIDKDFDQVINKMQSEIKDKDMLIHALQGSYDDLLLKYAEAENKIDRLRIRSLHNSPNKRYRSRQLFLDEFDFQPKSLEKHMPDTKREFSHPPSLEFPEDGLDDTVSFSFSGSNLNSPSVHSAHSRSDVKEVVISAPLGPIQKLYSTTVRLDKVLPSLGQLSPKSVHDAEASINQLPALAEDELAETEADHEDHYGQVKYYPAAGTGMSTNLYHATTDTGIEDCIQSITDNNTAGGNEGKAAADGVAFEPDLKRILSIPDEDAILKVQRWRESLPSDVTAPQQEAAPKTKKHRNRKAVLPKKTVGVQTSTMSTLGHSYHASSLFPTSPLTESDATGSPDMTDCDNCSSEIIHAFGRRQRSPTRMQCSTKNKPSGSRSKHQCYGECRSCGGAIVAPDGPSLKSPGAGPKDKQAPSRKARAGIERTEKNAIRRDQMGARKSSRCLSGAYFTRAVLLDMLLNAQTAHSCCCCCQHTWRGRPPAPSFSGDTAHHRSRAPGHQRNPLQQCLDEIQKLAWELKENLAANHDGLLNMVRKSE